MDLNHLRSFVTVAKFGHLTRAAEALHLSQPALSGHVKSLEEELGVTLFERTPTGMNVTPAGQTLLVEAEKIIDAVAHLAQSAQELRGQPTGHLKLGTVLEPITLKLGDLLVLAQQRYPQIELEIHHMMSSDALARVASGTLDASFYFGDEPNANLRAVALREITYRVAIPVAWADEVAGAAWDVLAERPWIVAPEPSTHRQLVMHLFGGKAPPKIIEADNESLIINLVASGVGASVVREDVIGQEGEAAKHQVWPGKSVATRLWLVYLAARDADPLIVALRDVLAEVWPAGKA